MRKLSRPIIFIYAFFINLFTMIFTLYTYFYARGQQKWLGELIHVRIFKIPLIFYIVMISIVISSLVVVIVYFVRRAQYGKIEEKIRMLASGNFESSLLSKKIVHAVDDEYIPDIDRDIQEVKDKMFTMSKELQLLANRPQMVAGESKEEILQEERHRLARELHDSVSQQLFAATMMLSALNEQAAKNQVSEPFQKQLNTVENIINASQSEMRALLLHLRPINLEGKSLRKGIEQLLIELQTKIQIGLVWEVEDVHLQSGIEDHLFRIVQELLSNTLRHAKASTLEVYLKQVEQTISLKMIDDGIGFDTKEGKVGSYGLQNIRERVTGMGGTCRIISFVGKGTSVEIKIPVIKECVEGD